MGLSELLQDRKGGSVKRFLLRNVIPHRYVCNHHLAGCYLWFRKWGLGMAVHEWGVRVLLGPWQLCLHWRKP